MKNILTFTYSLVSIFWAINLLTGCGTIEQTIYLGDVEVNAPVSPPPTHINVNKEVGNVTFSPRFTVLTSNNKITGSTEDRYNRTFRFSDDDFYIAKSENLEWILSKFIFGLDIDVKLAEKFSLFGGFHFSSGDNKNLAGGNFGIGIHNHLESPVIRLDLGMTIQKYEYFAVTIVHTKSTSIFGSGEYWDIYGDKGSTTNLNPFIALTFNSDYDSGLINWFIPVGFFTQNLLGFKPGTTNYPMFPFFMEYTKVDKRSDMLAGFLYINPGVSISLYKDMKILISAKTIREIVATGTDEWFFMPSVQIDFQL
ncbi:MAG: hypothetical protein R6W68_03585 [Ignavibacteriaceae bacterium]